MVGDVEVNENGPLPGQALPDDEENDNDNGDGNDNGSTAGGGGPTSDIGGGCSGSIDEAAAAAAPVDVEPDDPSMGFEYDGEVRKYDNDL